MAARLGACGVPAPSARRQRPHRALCTRPAWRRTRGRTPWTRRWCSTGPLQLPGACGPRSAPLIAPPPRQRHVGRGRPCAGGRAAGIDADYEGPVPAAGRCARWQPCSRPQRAGVTQSRRSGQIEDGADAAARRNGGAGRRGGDMCCQPLLTRPLQKQFHRRQQESVWRQRTKRSPFVVDLVAEDERINEVRPRAPISVNAGGPDLTPGTAPLLAAATMRRKTSSAATGSGASSGGAPSGASASRTTSSSRSGPLPPPTARSPAIWPVPALYMH